jgi:2-dehydro-3-deoxyglucarate aldolase/4-hydroxy-2-oxoheptanedioate aldolase
MTTLNLRRQTYGTFLGLATPLSAEIAALSGVDWVLLDLEHGASSEGDIGATVVAARAYGVPTLVRVESLSRIRIGRALDAGAAGVMIPQIANADDVREAVSYMSYPPTGKRGVATYNRSAAWGKDFSILQSGRNSACIIQIESKSALEDIDNIAGVDGVDVLFIGPLDLSFALGIPRDFSNPLFIAATERVIAAAKAHGKAAGILAADASTAIDLRNRGFEFIAIGSDSTILSSAISSIITQVKERS